MGRPMGQERGSGISQRTYQEPRAHALRARYLAMFGGPEIPVAVESIAEDFLGLRIEREYMDCSGMLLPAQRVIRINAAEAVAGSSRPASRARSATDHTTLWRR